MQTFMKNGLPNTHKMTKSDVKLHECYGMTNNKTDGRTHSRSTYLFSFPNLLFFMLASVKKSLFFKLNILFFTLELLFFPLQRPA
jgi:hypothetical protein